MTDSSRITSGVVDRVRCLFAPAGSISISFFTSDNLHAAHGLAGTPEDLTFLKKCLDERGGRDVLVHLARCNKGKTKDGVAEGGLRLADEVRGTNLSGGR